MAFHNDFWIAVAAAAPVIAVTQLVLFERTTHDESQAGEQKKYLKSINLWDEFPPVLRLGMWWFTSGPAWLTTISMAISTSAFFAALASLGRESDVWPDSIALLDIALPAALLLPVLAFGIWGLQKNGTLLDEVVRAVDAEIERLARNAEKPRRKQRSRPTRRR